MISRSWRAIVVHADRLEVVDRGAQADASTIAGVPASNFQGRLLNDVFSSSTDSDHLAAAHERRHVLEQLPRPQSAPVPLGPSILCPENAKKSQPSSCMSTARCGTLCAPSTTTIASRSWAQSQISRTGIHRPERVGLVHDRDDLDAADLLDLRELVEVEAAVVGQADVAQRAPVRFASSCHGTMLEWCSISLRTITSPGPQCALPYE